MAGVNPAFKAFRYHYFENARDLHSAKRIKEKKNEGLSHKPLW
jgi:hypothetical protein